MAYMLAVLNEEYERLSSKQKFYEIMIAELAHGSIQVKKINGKEYNYLCYREGKKVITKYVSPDEIENVKDELNRYKQAKIALKNIKENIKILDKVINNAS